MFEHDVWKIDPVDDGELVRRVYARSWPTTSRDDFPADEIIERLGDRDLSWWQRTIVRSPVRLAGGPANGGFGFALAESVGGGWDLSYLFCEPEAWGTGLAGALHDEAVAALRPMTDVVGAWVLVGNTRSQHFFEARSWVLHGVQARSRATTAEFFRYELALSR